MARKICGVTVEEKWKEAKREWEEKNRPDRADLGAYVNARILASFPNLLKAIQIWQDEHPDEPRIIGEGCEWGSSLGSANTVLYSAIRSVHTLRNSFLWDIARDACWGSAKIDLILEQARSMKGQKTTMRNAQGEEV
ncbi:uncharacterized protein yc1106_07676 [Curvularia clavata]|uniref:Uncharacterized protein n=1 Tax=Curvularia clavata TaxID=95742 RepID=A0A9Q8ZE98_CURCL|nr:uncharacterized protein yc1106_07676 [Curvularia clavata]